MKLGIIGLPGSGKSTIFEALTQSILPEGHKGENRIGTIPVPDQRLAVLTEMYKPKRTIYAQVEYFLPGMLGQKKNQKIWNQVRDCDALIHVIRNFSGYGLEKPRPYHDSQAMDQELILADLVVVEKKLENVELDRRRNKKTSPQEVSLLNQCVKNLENETPLRKCPDLASAHHLRGYAFLSAKPMMVMFNNEDEDDTIPEAADLTSTENCTVIRAKLEQELAQMSVEEAEEFLSEFNITASAMDRVIKQSYEFLGLISFFTVVNDEVKAWTVKKETQAVDAAGVIHTDMQKGFIRAEVISYEDLITAGTYHEARKKGNVRLEGKTYEVRDGDVITFRFNV
ncbi:redox-regulated ATPase YchF [Desulfobacteraceae bacterium SEEP-SAG10]|nr:redox-regulated ATPase YchF [Desulfobacteraceae bacterium SEEP-SAG10]